MTACHACIQETYFQATKHGLVFMTAKSHHHLFRERT